MIAKRLKEETRDLHQAVETRVDLLSRVSSRAAYQQLLEQFWGWYQPVEAKLAARNEWAAFDFSIEPRLKTTLLEHDLGALGLSSAERAALPQCSALPPLASFADALGCMYVLEGSTLGGQLIARQARASLGVTPEHGSAFFSSYGSQVGPMWKGFQELLQRAAPQAGEDAIIASARHTFVAFDQWLR